MSTTLLLGASNNPTRFSNKAQAKLIQHGHQVVLVNPKGGSINGIQCHTDLNDIEPIIDTVTVYINPSLVTKEVNKLVKLKPRRVIFNPGSESIEASQLLRQHGIEVLESCTLVLLDFDDY